MKFLMRSVLGVFVHLFQKVVRVWGAEPRVTAFSFRKAFSFVPAIPKEKASSVLRKRHGYRETDKEGSLRMAATANG